MPIRKPAYEVHRPTGRILDSREDELDEHAAEIFRTRRAQARTGGPLMVSGKPVTVDRAEMERILHTATGIAGPREKDPANGYLYIGAFVYVPIR